MALHERRAEPLVRLDKDIGIEDVSVRRCGAVHASKEVQQRDEKAKALFERTLQRLRMCGARTADLALPNVSDVS